MLRKMFVASACLALAGAAFLPAADDKETAPRTASAAGQSNSNMRNPDHLMATCVALANQEEVALAQIARQKATNDEVKRFADMMLTDHHDFLLKLQKFAPEATQADYLNITPQEAANDAKTGKSEIKQTAADDDKDNGAVENADAKSERGHHGFNHMKLEREMAAQCLSDAKEKLAEKSGSQFDKCFIGMQIGMHSAMKSKLTVLQRHASPELAKLFAAGLKTTEKHLARAEEIMGDLEGTSTTTTKIKEGGSKRVIKETTKE